MDPSQLNLIRKSARVGQIIGSLSILSGGVLLIKARRKPPGVGRTAAMTAGRVILTYGVIQAGGATFVRWGLS